MSHPVQINHPVYCDIPEAVLIAFLMIWDLTEDRDTLEKELFGIVDEIIEKLPLFELPSRTQVAAVYDLTDHIEVLPKKGRGVAVKVKSSRSVT